VLMLTFMSNKDIYNAPLWARPDATANPRR